MAELGFEEICIKTPRTSYMQRSVGYVLSSLMERVGLEPVPQARPKSRSLPRRALYKALRLAVAEPFAQAAALARTGPSLEIVFRKPTQSVRTQRFAK